MVIGGGEPPTFRFSGVADAQLRPDVREHVAVHGVGVDTAGQPLVNAGDNRDRLRPEASLARLCGAAPVPE